MLPMGENEILLEIRDDYIRFIGKGSELKHYYFVISVKDLIELIKTNGVQLFKKNLTKMQDIGKPPKREDYVTYEELIKSSKSD